MFTGPAIGVIKEKLLELTVNGIRGEQALKGDRITISVEAKVTLQDKLYKMIPSSDE